MADANRPHIHVEFHSVPVEDLNESRKQGRPIFKDVEHCRIRWAGDNKRELDEPANQKFKRDPETNRWITYAEAFPEHYRLFKANEDQDRVNGTPLSEVPFLTEAKRAELRALNVRSLEALASLDGAALQRLGMGGRDLKNKAQAFIDAASGTATETRLAEENAALTARLEALEAMVNSVAIDRTVAPAAAPVSEPDDDTPSGSPFEAWGDEDIKNWIKDQAGARPVGNPSHKTLVAKADEINAALAEKAAA